MYVTDNSNIELPNGSSYRLPLYNPLTISLYFGSYPQTNLSQSDTEVLLFNTNSGAAVELEPVYEKISAFHVDIKYATVEQALSGRYEVRIREGLRIVASQPITIDVTGKYSVLTLNTWSYKTPGVWKSS